MKTGDIWKRIINFLKTLITHVAAERFFRSAVYLFSTVLKMRYVDIAEPVSVVDVPVEFIIERTDFRFLDRDIIRGELSHVSEIPESGKYKLIAFHNGPEGISVGLINFIANIFRWKPATLPEVIAVGQNCCFKNLGLEQGSAIASLGTIVRKSSAISSWFSLYYSPVVGFYVREAEGKQIKEMTIRLHDLSDNYPSDQYLLVRVG